MKKLIYLFLLCIPAIMIASDGPNRNRRRPRARVITPEDRALLDAALQAEQELAAAKVAKEKAAQKPPVPRPETIEFAKIDELEKIVIPVPNKDLGSVALTLKENDEPTDESLTFETFVDLIKGRLNSNNPYILAHVKTDVDKKLKTDVDKKEFSHFYDAHKLDEWLDTTNSKTNQKNDTDPSTGLKINSADVTYYKLTKSPDGFVNIMYIGSKADKDAKMGARPKSDDKSAAAAAAV